VKHVILDRIRGVRKQPQPEEDSMEDEAIAREQGARAGGAHLVGGGRGAGR
jgi:membrane protein